MARPLRIDLAGGLYHVTARGDDRDAIYSGDDDRRAWLEVFAGVCGRFNWRCHAWCQMTNHYHVLVETPEADLASGMRQLNGVYTQHINRTHGRVGHVFQVRYAGILVKAESYLLEAARYIGSSRWDELQEQAFLGSEQFVERMKARLPETDLREVPRAQRRRAPPPLSSFTAMADRQAGMAAAYRSGGYSMNAIGDAFGVHYATVSRAVRRAEVWACKP